MNWKSSDSKDIAPNHSGVFFSSLQLLIVRVFVVQMQLV